jgi:HlyD family secretion protein
MDRPIDRTERQRRTIRRGLIGLAAVALSVAALTLLTGWVRPSVRRDDIRVGRVVAGAAEATITAGGLIVPEYESVITSPVDTRVAKILRRPGESVGPDDPIVTLDAAEPEAELRKLDDQVALKRNAIDAERLALETTLTDLRGRRALEVLEQKSLERKVERNRRLLELGVISKDAAEATEIDLEKSGIEISQLDEAMKNAAADLERRLAGLELEMSILRRDREESARRLARATATADRAGVVTWVVPVEGAAVRRGDELARVADLGSYGLEATLSDVHAGRVRPGQAVRVEVGARTLSGRVTTVRPTVTNGLLTIEAALDDPSAPELRPSLRVDAHIVTERRAGTLRVARGSFLTRDGESAVFVLDGGRARRRPVTFGIVGFDSVEVLSGLEAGDDIILNDMSNYREAREVTIR